MGTHLVARIKKWLKRIGFALTLVLLTVFAVRAFDAWRAPPLKLWHTEALRELDARQIDGADWAAWMAAEDALFEQVRIRVTDKLPAADRVPANRYFDGSPLYAARFATDWNRSYILTPAGEPRGAVVLLHGLTDSPYSLRHIAARYRERGFVVIGIRLPGHGTVPAALTTVNAEDWQAATRLAMRTARGLAGVGKPLHLVGYSNGAALALEYTLDTFEDHGLTPPDQIILISPMIGITSLARFTGVLGWPAVFPPFAKAAWLDVIPEYNPFKYNSFPVNAARQSSLLVRRVESKLRASADDGSLAKLPPVLTFQSVPDFTVFTSAVIDTLYARVPRNGSELVLFERNLNAEVEPLIRPEHAVSAQDLLPPAPRNYTVVIVTNAAENPAAEEARTTAAGSDRTVTQPLRGSYPAGMYSLSHVALPFPLDDGLYGSEPTAAENFGLHLGTVAVRGERGMLVVSNETLMRATANPFFDFLLERIESKMGSDPINVSASPP